MLIRTELFIQKVEYKKKERQTYTERPLLLFKQSTIAQLVLMVYRLENVGVHRPLRQNSRQGDVQRHEPSSAFHRQKSSSVLGKFRFHQRFRQPGSNKQAATFTS
jgi:hypothetical protein